MDPFVLQTFYWLGSGGGRGTIVEGWAFCFKWWSWGQSLWTLTIDGKLFKMGPLTKHFHRMSGSKWCLLLLVFLSFVPLPLVLYLSYPIKKSIPFFCEFWVSLRGCPFPVRWLVVYLVECLRVGFVFVGFLWCPILSLIRLFAFFLFSYGWLQHKNNKW